VKKYLSLVFLMICISAFSSVSTNGQACSKMKASLKSDSGTTVCGTNTTNTITRTIAYNVTCVGLSGSSQSGKVYSSDVSTIIGTGECGLVDCYPTFTTSLFNSNSTSTQNSFTQTSTNYYSLFGCHSNGGSTDTRFCDNLACQTSGCTGSPVILDVSGKGFDLTSAENGVSFDIAGTGKKVQIAWTDASADNAFLSLPGTDGLIHSGKELFGNFTAQPPALPQERNGFAALAVYDDPKNGGNGDGIIDSRDAVFASLRLWIDANHDGISQPEELHTLPSLGVNSISLKYKEDDKTDQYGNVFRYRAHLNPDKPTDAGKTAYDVFLVVGQTTAKNLMPHYQTIGLRIRPPIFPQIICP
jgi:hypothetical protein